MDSILCSICSFALINQLQLSTFLTVRRILYTVCKFKNIFRGFGIFSEIVRVTLFWGTYVF